MPNTSTPEPPKKTSWPEKMRAIAEYTNLGWTLVISIILGMLAGRWADARLGTEPWLFLVGAVLGIAVGLYNFLLTTLRK